MKKIYKIVMMSGEEIPLESREALDNLISEANKGTKLVMTKYGVVNLSSIDSIVLHKELMREAYEQMKVGIKEDEAIQEALGPGVFDGDKKLLA
jgi:hypothetical protein